MSGKIKHGVEYPSNLMVRWESMAVTKIDCYFHDEFLWPATGFFYKFGQTIALVTNWHVLSGVNPLTKVNASRRNFYPNKAKFALPLYDRETHIVEIRGVEITTSESGKTYWYQHKCCDPITDIAVADLGEVLPDFSELAHKVVSIPAYMALSEDMQRTSHAYPLVSSEVFIVGFPQGLQLQGVLPIWKRGTIASEPLIGLNGGQPVVMVDATTRKGMSGSPVLYYGKHLKTDEGHPMLHERETDPWLIGVYAGRDGVTDDEYQMSLGRIWKRNVLDDLFFEKTRMRGLNAGSGLELQEFLSP